MAEISRSALVMHQAEKMYALVNDVESYPQFLPWCSGASVIEKSTTTQTASIEISVASVKQRFTTRNTMSPGESIQMSLVDGPFSELSGGWNFKALGDAGCKISLDVHFEFSNQVVAKSVGPAFSAICGSLVEAFCKRADQLD